MSGTYLDTSQYNAGVATMETYANYFDKNYCLVLEVAGRVDDTVTVSCTANVPEIPPVTTASSVPLENTPVSDDIVTTSQTAIVDIFSNQSTLSNETGALSVNATESSEQTTKQDSSFEGYTNTSKVIASTVAAEELSKVAVESTIETTTSIVVNTTEARATIVAVDFLTVDSSVGTAVTEMVDDNTTRQTVAVDNISRNSITDNVVSEISNETTAATSNESKPENLTAGAMTTEAIFELTTTKVVSSSSLSSTSQPSSIIDTVSNSIEHIMSENVSDTPHELDIMFTSSLENNIDNSNLTLNNASVDNADKFDSISTSNVSETKPQSTLVTGTVLFNRGGTGLSKTIQNIDSFHTDIYNDKNMIPEPSTTYSPKTTNNMHSFNTDNSYKVTKESSVSTDILSKSNVLLTTLPTDISNSLVMGTSSSFIESDNANISGNGSNNSDINYSLQFPVYDPLITSTNNTENATKDLTTTYSYNTHNENNTLYLDINYDKSSSENAINIISNETNTDTNNNQTMDLPNRITSNYLLNMESSTFRNNPAGNAVQSTEVTNKLLQTSPYITNEARLIMESSEPTDIIANIPIKTPEIVENTTIPMATDFTKLNANETSNISGKDNLNLDSNVKDNESLASTLIGFQVELTDSTVYNRPKESFPEINNQTATEANSLPSSNVNDANYSAVYVDEISNNSFDSVINSKMVFDMTSAIVPTTPRPLDAFNEEQLNQNTPINNTDAYYTLPGSQESNVINMTSSSVPTTPRSLDDIYKEQLNQNAPINNTDVYYTLPGSQESNVTEYGSEISKVVFDKRNTVESTTYALPAESIFENLSDNNTLDQIYDIPQVNTFSEVLNETKPFDGDNTNTVRLQAPLIHSNMSMYEVNTNESTTSPLGLSDAHFQNNVNLFEGSAIQVEKINKTSDVLSVLHEGNETSIPYINQTSPVINQETTVNVETTSSTVDITAPLEMSGKVVSQISFVNRISDPYRANMTDRISDIANENFDVNTNSHIVDQNDTNSALNQTSAEIVDQSTLVSNEMSLSYDPLLNESTSFIYANDAKFGHYSSETDVNVTENIPTDVPQVLTEMIDNLTSINRFDEQTNNTDQILDMNVTDLLPNAAFQGLPLAGETTSSYSINVQTTEAIPAQSGQGGNIVYQSREFTSMVNVTENLPTQNLDILTDSVDNMTFIQRFDEPQIQAEHIQQINMTQTLPTPADQESTLASEATGSYLLNAPPASEATPVNSGQDINRMTFVPRLNELTSEVNVTENTHTQIIDVVTESINNLTFIHRMDNTSFRNENILDNNLTEPLTNAVDQEFSLLVEKTTNTHLPNVQSRITTPMVRKVDSIFKINESLANDIVTESTPYVMAESGSNFEFVNSLNDNLVNVVDRESSTVKSDTSSSLPNSLGTETSRLTTVTDKVINDYLIDSSIDKHNLLSSTDSVPFDIVRDNEISNKVKTPNSTTLSISTTAYSFEKEVQTEKIRKVNETATVEPPIASTLSDLVKFTTDQTTGNFGEKATSTESAPMVVEDIIVKENVHNIFNAIPENTMDNTISSDSIVPADILADIEKQIIPDNEQSTHTVSETSSLTTHSQQETYSSTTSHPTLVSNDTVHKNITVNEVSPEPIIPMISSDIDGNVPTTPKQSFDKVDDVMLVEDPERTVTDKPAGSGLNVYFDTGKSKSSAFDLNNDTYIIVVGAIVGLVVLAVVIGIFCHNGRKRRSEKVNISGNNAEAPHHQNQAFDNEAVNDVQGSIVTQNGGGSPEVNGSASGADVNNGNVEL